MQEKICKTLFQKKKRKTSINTEWKLDQIRDDDESQMNFLVQNLQKMRKKEEVSNIEMKLDSFKVKTLRRGNTREASVENVFLTVEAHVGRSRH